MKSNGQLREMEIINALQETEKQKSDLVKMACLILTEKHGGCCDIPLERVPQNAQAFQGWSVKVEVVPVVNIFRLQVVTPDGKNFVPLTDTNALEIPAAEPLIEEPEPESKACDNEWHVNPDRMGRACPFCGSKVVLDGASA